jgi:predicted SAM-dependent methyltransferase/glycosyltransferase involved in cell wall biosynthesis
MTSLTAIESGMIKVLVPFKGQVLEVGGGDIPLFRPNLDMRKLPTVDFVCDLEEPWPIENESFDGVYGKFVMEHISWRKVPDFVFQCVRVLKPDGWIAMIIPNTLEQARIITQRGLIGLDESAMLFGGQEERGWNEHKAAFSPEYAFKLFAELGCDKVTIETWPGQLSDGARPDMIIAAHKPAMYAKVVGNRQGWIRDHVKASDSILDLGIGPANYWEGRGYNVVTVDNNPAYKPKIVCQAEAVPLPDKSVDVVVLGDILEHYDDPSILLNEAIRLAKKRIVITVPWEERWSKNLTPFEHTGHKQLFTETLLRQELAQYPYRCTTEEIVVDVLNRPYENREEHWSWVGAIIDLTSPPPVRQPPAGRIVMDATPKVKLNIGSFTVMAKGWTNIDVLDLTAYAVQQGMEFRQMDVRKGLGYGDNTVDLVIASHFLEHITRNEGSAFIRECFRTLKPGGIIRITVPDTQRIAEEYITRARFQKIYGFNEGVKNASDDAEAFWNLLTAGHVTAYDHDSMTGLMTKAGFVSVENKMTGQSNSQEIKAETQDMYPELSLYMEGVKPLTIARHVQWGVQESRKLRIGLISTQFFGVPPSGYSGLERVVWDLACGLSERGHMVRVFGPEGSQAPPNGEVYSTGPMLSTVNADWVASEQSASMIYKDLLGDLDIVHGHNWFGFEFACKQADPRLKTCHTHHGHMNPQWWIQNKAPFPLNMIAISKHMKEEYRGQGMPSEYAYNGIDLDMYKFSAEKGDRFLYVGRLDTFKRPDFAIECCRKANVGLDVVGGSFVSDPAYLERIKQMADGQQIRVFLDASHEKKIELMQHARALIFPSKMGEPFGLVAAEAGACGTFVIASPDGAIGEVVEHGLTGQIVADQQMVDAISHVNSVIYDPAACRSRVATLFSRQKMAERYEELYLQILGGKEW